MVQHSYWLNCNTSKKNSVILQLRPLPCIFCMCGLPAVRGPRSNTDHRTASSDGHGRFPGCFRPHTHTKTIRTKGPMFSVDFGVDKGPRVVVGAAGLLDRAPRTVYRASSRWASTWTTGPPSGPPTTPPQETPPAGSPGGSPPAGPPGGPLSAGPPDERPPLTIPTHMRLRHHYGLRTP